jgi:uncharacterized protein YndB with AHSA1/START domain
MSDERMVTQTVVVDTTPELAFEAVTQASELREWMCDRAETEVWPGGRYEVRWQSGYRAEGTFTELNPPHRAAFTWHGTDEPGQTAVTAIITPRDEGVEVALIHSGFGPGAEWDAPLAASGEGWASGLENLKSTLETGVDLRLARQPFLGINLDLLTPERAAQEGIAVERGIYVLDAVEGSGADAAGLGHGDVIVALGGKVTLSFQELTAALRAHRAGEVVDVELVRRQARETVQVTLGQRPQVDVPNTAEELASLLAERYGEVNTELKAAVEGLTEEETEQAPAEGEWSVKHILAHLSSDERAVLHVLVNVAVNGWLDIAPISPDQIPGQLEAVLVVTPTLQALVERLFADEAELVAFLRRLPSETMAHKARFRRIGQRVLFGPDHTREHIRQIQRTIQVVRGG